MSHWKEMNEPSQSSQQWRESQERGDPLMGLGGAWGFAVKRRYS